MVHVRSKSDFEGDVVGKKQIFFVDCLNVICILESMKSYCILNL